MLLFDGGIGEEEDVTDADDGGGLVVLVFVEVAVVGRTIRGAEGGEIDDGGGGITAAVPPTCFRCTGGGGLTFNGFTIFISSSGVFVDSAAFPFRFFSPLAFDLVFRLFGLPPDADTVKGGSGLPRQFLTCRSILDALHAQ